MSKRIYDFWKILERYLIYFVIMAIGIFLYLFAVLPLWKFDSTITSLLTNEILNNFLISIGTGIIGSALTALLIDWRNEKRELERNYKIKSIMLSDLINDLELLEISTYSRALVAQQKDGRLDKMVDEIRRIKDNGSVCLNVKEYNLISEIETIIVRMRKKFTADYNKYIIEYEKYIEEHPEYEKRRNRNEYIKIIEDQFGLNKDEADYMYSNIELFYLDIKFIKIALSHFDSLDTNPRFWLFD